MRLKTKKPPINEGFFLAPAPGLEPGTRGLTVHCSNQLSYAGINSLYRVDKLKLKLHFKQLFYYVWFDLIIYCKLKYGKFNGSN